MLTHSLYLAAAWFVISMVATLLAGARLRRTNALFSVGWLGVVLGLGDVWALFTFGRPQEVLVLTVLAAVLGLCCLRWLRDWNALGQVALPATILATGLFAAYIFRVIVSVHLSPVSFLIAQTFLFIQVVASAVALTVTYENLDLTCRVHWRHRQERIEPAPGYTPMVSLHLPAYDEPPEIVAQTLRALAALDYPAYEVLVVDNNTPREETWHPIEELCHELGPRFRFLHLENWPGYKSGALNFALAQTSPDAELVGVVDADYHVQPHFLRETVPAFTDPQIAFIQTPQDYRDYEEGTYSEAIYYGYEYFFEVPMPVRNEHNAIIFAGTMGLIRKFVLQEIGGWDEECITEDAEASLRIHKRGYKSIYYHHSMGRGLMPCTFAGLKRQRFRWCFGNIQILRKHWESLMPWARWVDPQNRLTPVQRYFYLAGGLQWLADVFNLAFVFFLVAGGVVTVFSADLVIEPVAGPLMALAAIFMLLNLWRLDWVLHHALKLSWGLAFRSMYGIFSVSWVVGLAGLRAMVETKTAFLRTPKTGGDTRMLNALLATEWEVAIGLVCLAMAVAVLVVSERTFSSYFLSGLLLWQASLYLAAPVYSLFYKACTL